LKYQVRLAGKAEQDVDDILQWFSEQRAPAAGQRWFKQLMASVATLEKHAERCALAAEAEDVGLPIRQLLIGKRQVRYRILFQIVDQTVNVLRVWHSARDAVAGEDL
jgi:plasmid stabilization system protein ParE